MTVPIGKFDVSPRSQRGDPGLRMTPANLRQLLRKAVPSDHPAGTTIIHEGTLIGSAYLIRDGLVKLVANLSNGKERILRLRGRGAWIGLEGLLNPASQHSAVAVYRVESFRIPLHRLLRLKDENLELYCWLVESWHGSLREADLWLTEFSCGSVRARVARLVHYLSSAAALDCPAQVELLKFDEMAAIVAATPESVSRTIAEFKRCGVLGFHDGAGRSTRYVVNQQALRSFASE